MRTKKWTHRLFTFLLVALLISTLALTAYASSDKFPYSFTFNMSPGTRTVRGEKTDMDDVNTRGKAGASLLAGNLGAGYVRYWVNNTSGRTITAISSYTNTIPNNFELLYTDLSGVQNGTTLILYCQATANVHGVSGNFQP